MKAAGCVAAAMALLLGYPANGKGCSCTPPPPPQAVLAASDVVFAGLLVGVKPPKSGISDCDLVRYSLRVTHAWKGVVADTLVNVYSERTGACCGVQFSKGEHYIVYARAAQAFRDLPPVLLTDICTRTGLLGDAFVDVLTLPTPADSLEDDDQATRLAAARALVQIGERMDVVVPALVKMLRSKDPFDRLLAAKALTDLSWRARGAAPVLKKALRDQDGYVRDQAAQALKNMGIESDSLSAARKQGHTW